MDWTGAILYGLIGYAIYEVYEYVKNKFFR